jgi:hypothetical protein
MWWTVLVVEVLLAAAALRWPHRGLRAAVAAVLLATVLLREFEAPVSVRRLVSDLRPPNASTLEYGSLGMAVSEHVGQSSGYVVLPALLLAALVVWRGQGNGGRR